MLRAFNAFSALRLRPVPALQCRNSALSIQPTLEPNMASYAYADYDLHLHSQWSYDATADIRDYFRLGERGVRALL